MASIMLSASLQPSIEAKAHVKPNTNRKTVIIWENNNTTHITLLFQVSNMNCFLYKTANQYVVFFYEKNVLSSYRCHFLLTSIRSKECFFFNIIVPSSVP